MRERDASMRGRVQHAERIARVRREGVSRHVLALHDALPGAVASGAKRAMDATRVRAAIEVVLASPARALEVRLVGDDASSILDAVARLRAARRGVALTLETSGAGLDDDVLARLVEAGVALRTPLESARTGWVERLNAAYAQRGVDADEAYVVATVDEDVASARAAEDAKALGLRYVELVPSVATKSTLAAVEDPWLDAALAAGLVERRAAVAIERWRAASAGELAQTLPWACTCEDGVLAFTPSGVVSACPCSDAFELGRFDGEGAAAARYASIVRGRALEVVLAASGRALLPSCATCRFEPTCGVCPSRSVASGGLVAPLLGTPWCTAAMALFTRIERDLGDPGSALARAEPRWVASRARVEAHYRRFVAKG